MVVMASFFAVFLMGTCITSFAVLYPEFIIAFDLTQAEGAWIGSAQFALAFVNSKFTSFYFSKSVFDICNSFSNSFSNQRYH